MNTEMRMHRLLLAHYKDRLTKQQYKTLKGQIMKGDYEGAKKGLVTILKKA